MMLIILRFASNFDSSKFGHIVSLLSLYLFDSNMLAVVLFRFVFHFSDFHSLELIFQSVNNPNFSFHQILTAVVPFLMQFCRWSVDSFFFLLLIFRVTCTKSIHDLSKSRNDIFSFMILINMRRHFWLEMSKCRAKIEKIDDWRWTLNVHLPNILNTKYLMDILHYSCNPLVSHFPLDSNLIDRTKWNKLREKLNKIHLMLRI